MRPLLIAIISLSLLAIFSTTATADEAKEAPAPVPSAASSLLEVNTSMFSRHEMRRGYNDLALSGPGRLNADQDNVFYRARMGFSVGHLPQGNKMGVIARFVPQASGVWHIGGDGLEDAALGLHEGFIEIKTSAARIDVGRFEMAYGEHLVIGSVGWHQTARSFDGARVHIQPTDKGAWTDIFVTEIGEGTVNGFNQDSFAEGDKYLMGVYSNIGPMIAKGLDLDFYALEVLGVGGNVGGTDPVTGATANVTVDGSSLTTLGLRVKGKAAGMLNYRLEAGYQLGSASDDVNIAAWQADAEIGVTFSKKKYSVSVEGLMASGDDPNTADTNEGWNQLFPTAHKWLGFADVIGKRTNVASAVLHLTAKVHPNVKIYMHNHVFWRVADTINAAGETLGAEMAGMEADTGTTWTLSKGLKLRANFSVFLPSDKTYPVSDTAILSELELSYNY